MALNLKDFQRFEKQIILKKIGIAGQKKIEKAKVVDVISEDKRGYSAILVGYGHIKNSR